MKRTKTPSLDQSKLQQLPPPQLHICCKKRADFVKATGLFEMEFPGLGPPGTWRIRGPWNGTAALRQGPVAHGTRAGNMGWPVPTQGSYGEGQNAPFWIGLNLATLTRPAGLQGRPAHGGKSLDQKYMSGQVTRCPRDSAVRCI